VLQEAPIRHCQNSRDPAGGGRGAMITNGMQPDGDHPVVPRSSRVVRAHDFSSGTVLGSFGEWQSARSRWRVADEGGDVDWLGKSRAGADRVADVPGEGRPLVGRGKHAAGHG
jgi:hypothetical protein